VARLLAPAALFLEYLVFTRVVCAEDAVGRRCFGVLPFD
jgi:hypothetical protein